MALVASRVRGRFIPVPLRRVHNKRTPPSPGEWHPACRCVLGRRRSLASCLSLRTPHSARLFPVPRIPISGLWPPSAVLAVFSPLGLPACGGSLVPRPPACPPGRACPPCRSYSSVLCILDYAFLPRDGCPQVSGSPFPVPRSPLLGVIHNGVWPFVHVKTVKFGSKSIKKATFSVKKGSKRRAFRHAHLDIWGGHPLWR